MKYPDNKNGKIIIKYKQYLKLEKSLSENTVQAYLADLDKLQAYLTLEELSFTEVTLDILEHFSAGLHDIGIHPRSQARILGYPVILSFPATGRLYPTRPHRTAGISTNRKTSAGCADRRRN